MAAADPAPALSQVAVAEPAPLSPRQLRAEILPFQDALEQVLAASPPPLLRRITWLAALLFLSLLAAACLLQVDIVVAGSGRLAADAPPLVLQPLERGVIRELRAKPGDVVGRGQVLALLDTTFSDADLAQLQAQQRAARALHRRLEAELAGTPLPPAPPGADADTLAQALLHAQRQALLASRQRAYAEEIAGLEAGLRTLQGNAAALAEQVAIARDVESMRSRLLAGQVGSRLQYLAARSHRLQTEQELQQLRNRLAEGLHGVDVKRAERQSFLEDWRRQLLEEQLRARAELVRIEEALAKAARLGELLSITAPEDGIVLEIARRSVGSVVREAEPLVTLVPAQAPLIAELVLRSADIGYPQPGNAVRVKVDAFPYQRHGAVAGRLRSIIQDSVAPQGEAPGAAGALHRAQVALENPALRNLPPGARLLPGMSLHAEITVGRRRVIAYFLDPLIRGFEEAIREP